MTNQKKVRVLYIGFTKHGFLWLKRRRTWLVQIHHYVGLDDSPSGHTWETVSKHYAKHDALAEEKLWKSNQN